MTTQLGSNSNKRPPTDERKEALVEALWRGVCHVVERNPRLQDGHLDVEQVVCHFAGSERMTISRIFQHIQASETLDNTFAKSERLDTKNLHIIRNIQETLGLSYRGCSGTEYDYVKFLVRKHYSWDSLGFDDVAEYCESIPDIDDYDRDIRCVGAPLASSLADEWYDHVIQNWGPDLFKVESAFWMHLDHGPTSANENDVAEVENNINGASFRTEQWTDFSLPDWKTFPSEVRDFPMRFQNPIDKEDNKDFVPFGRKI